MKLKNLFYLILIILLLSVLACAPPKISLMDYIILPDIDSKKAIHFLPDYVVQKKKPKIAVLPPSDTTQYSKCQLYRSAWEYLVQTLARSGSVEVVERSHLNAIMEELKFRAGISGDIDPGRLVKIAEGVDFIFVGSISKAYTGVRFTPSSSWTDKKGRTHYTAASCNEEAEAGLVFRLLEFPAGTVQKAFNMNGKETIYRQVSSQYDCKVQDICGLLNRAIDKAIENAKEDIMNAFPVFGYIYKTMSNRKNPRERIAFITLGTSDGIKAGSKVEIIEFIKEKDPVKDMETLTTRIVGECTVSDTDLQSDRSICIIAEDSVDKVFPGHAVKTKLIESFWQKLKKL